MKPLKNKEKYASTIWNEIRELACIPLQNGKWIAITEGAVFFPHTDGIRIPTDLGLNIVDEKSITNQSRKEFFVALGVELASIQTIRALVLGRYSQESSSIDFETPLEDLHFLYSTHSPGTTVKLRDSTSLWVFNHRYNRIHDEEDLYFSEEDILDSDEDEDDLYIQSHQEYSFQDLMGSSWRSRHTTVPSLALTSIPSIASKSKIFPSKAVDLTSRSKPGYKNPLVY